MIVIGGMMEMMIVIGGLDGNLVTSHQLMDFTLRLGIELQ